MTQTENKPQPMPFLKREPSRLVHRFWILPEATYAYTDYLVIYTTLRHEAVELDDDLIWYINDTLGWIPTINPASPSAQEGYGLNPYGPTIINQDGAAIAQHVFGSWATLLMHGPHNLAFRGSWEQVLHDTDEPMVEQEGFAIIHWDRDTLVERLRTLERYAVEVGSGQFFLLHTGL
jgi:hypothetical protein